jgi:folate-dependent phosphoribosylglycinamide formyltransferase PurN
VVVADQREVAVALAPRDLVDRDLKQVLEPISGQQLIADASDDPPDGLPVDPDQLGDRGLVSLGRQSGDEIVKVAGESGAVAGERQPSTCTPCSGQRSRLSRQRTEPALVAPDRRGPVCMCRSIGENKGEAEERLVELLEGRCDLVVLARYMQVLSGSFLTRIGVPVINIYHSFLPAFPGAGPYERAKERGVKLIGATAHYVTEELDAGPIIEQDVIRVNHRDDLAAVIRLGAEVERAVLARAVQWHCQDCVVRHGDTTVVFA